MKAKPSLSTTHALHHHLLLEEVWNRYLEERKAGDSLLVEEVRELDASCLPITDVRDFAMFKRLRYLDLSLTEVRDLSPLAALPDLRELHLTFHRGIELEGLESLTQLRILDLSYPRHAIPRLDRLGDLDQLEELYLNGCGLSTLAHFMPLERLRVLSLSFNLIPLRERNAFRELNPGCAILD